MLSISTSKGGWTEDGRSKPYRGFTLKHPHKTHPVGLRDGVFELLVAAHLPASTPAAPSSAPAPSRRGRRGRLSLGASSASATSPATPTAPPAHALPRAWLGPAHQVNQRVSAIARKGDIKGHGSLMGEGGREGWGLTCPATCRCVPRGEAQHGSRGRRVARAAGPPYSPH